MIEDGLSIAKRRLLETLQRRQPATAADLAGELGLTEAAVRQHLAALEVHAMVASAPTTARGPGRPGAVWSLTDAAGAVFANRHGDLTVQLLDAIRAALGDQGLQQVIDARTADQLRDYERALTRAGTSVRSRVHALARRRDAEGYMAEVVADDDGFVLVEHHCPIREAAQSCVGLCGAELELFRRALGDRVTVERTEHVLNGSPRCAYAVRVKPAPALADG